MQILYAQHHWETAIFADDNWRYVLPTSEMPSGWNTISFDDNIWNEGPGGFGYSDGDDGTIISTTISVYLRTDFFVTDVTKLSTAILSADYDDGFIAYINGNEIGRSYNLPEPGTFVDFNEVTSYDHEASLYNGGQPESFVIDSIALDTLLTDGDNVLAIQVHNVGINSSDMSSNFFLTFGISDNSMFYSDPPSWFQAPFSFLQSNLPIVIIDTNDEEIVNDPRIIAHMGIINNETGMNHMGDPFNGYDGQISIEIRGSSSQNFPKKQYALETQDSEGENLNVPILGMPEENDWILHAPYSDKSLLRNYLAYELARDMGSYASRTRFCELVINGDYKGLYIFMEKIKQDNNRVDISKLEPDETSGDNLTGGYIVKIDKWNGETNDGWYSEPLLDDFDGLWYQFHYPKPDNIVEEQRDYIMDYITDFETIMSSDTYNDPAEGYYEKVNLESFIDVSFLGEISKNVDAYRLSAYMYKDKDSVDGRLTMGPIWDYNLAFGNADYYDGWNPEGWQMDVELGNDGFKIPFWWYRIWDDTTYLTAFNQRWQDLRESIFSEDYIMSLIDSATTLIDDAQIRNFQRWPVLDEYVWPNAYVGGSYAYEIEYLKNWINNRLEWMDSELLLLNVKEDIIASEISVKRPYPNPFNPKTAFVVNLTNKSSIRLDIYNILGKKVKSINKNVFPQGKHTITWNATNAIGGQVESGVYLYELLVNNRLETGKLLYIK
ncbi:MAG: CotH kinase family protein [Candidatus Neomarinimicrobiota bacterium]|nr:CotH kinase family protein [Candidatus Neomarinimicrobiota bacterium]